MKYCRAFYFRILVKSETRGFFFCLFIFEWCYVIRKMLFYLISICDVWQSAAIGECMRTGFSVIN